MEQFIHNTSPIYKERTKHPNVTMSSTRTFHIATLSHQAAAVTIADKTDVLSTCLITHIRVQRNKFISSICHGCKPHREQTKHVIIESVGESDGSLPRWAVPRQCRVVIIIMSIFIVPVSTMWWRSWHFTLFCSSNTYKTSC